MTFLKKKDSYFLTFISVSVLLSNSLSYASAHLEDQPHEMRFIQIEAKTKQDRSAIANLGVSIEATRTGSVWGFANDKEIQRLRKANFKILGNFDEEIGRGGHDSIFDFPDTDSRFHNYQELQRDLESLRAKNADITSIQSIGKSVEGRDIWAFHINSNPEALNTGNSNKPGVIFMGNHHAREHVSAEIPYMLAKYLLDNRENSQISTLLNTRDIWIIPMVNPDGVEWDISTGRYKWWRKNRKNNGDGTYGVDLNRNYGFQWGTGGSEKDSSSEIYMGKQAFSEPETLAIRDFVNNHLNTKTLLTFHTFSELILYPWGHTYNSIQNTKDLAVFEKMAKQMASWNHYTPEQSSELYIASGDTTDWAYGEHGIFAFTFELSPSNIYDGGFYPGVGVIDKVFQDNLKPCLYLIEMAGNPYQVLDHQPNGWLKNYVEPAISSSDQWQSRPFTNRE